jgi:negative regulator of flagellin synthesis FlgM
MEIDKNQGVQVDAYVNQVQDKKKADQAADQAKESATKTDTVVISDAAKRIQEARSKLDEIPDVREDKVAELKNQIQNGTYQPDAQKTADKLLKEQLGNAVIEDKLDI